MKVTSPPRAHTISAVVGLMAAFAAWHALFEAQLGKPTLSSRWTWELLEHKQEIASRARGPKVVIAGGSSALFGIRAEQLTRELDVPVYNMATYAALGLSYMLHRTKGMVAAGDTVILSLEYELYSHDPFPPQVDYLAAHDTAYFRSLPLLRRLNGELRMDVGRALSPWLADPARSSPRNGLNAYEAENQLGALGDALGNNAVLKNDRSRDLVESLQPIPVELKAANEREIQAFAQWARAHSVKVLATHPALIDFGAPWRTGRLLRTMAAIDAFHSRIGMPFVDRWDDVLYPRAYFFDTVYHLDSVAAGIRTRALASRVSAYIDRSGAWGPHPSNIAADHPLAELAKNFSGWEPTSGFGAVEGPYPQWHLGPVIWALSPRSELVVRTDGASDATFTASLRGSAAGQHTDLVVNGEHVASIAFEDDQDFRDWTARVHLRAGDNFVALVQSGASAQAALIRRLRFDAP